LNIYTYGFEYNNNGCNNCYRDINTTTQYYLIQYSAGRFEFFLVPKAGVTPQNGDTFNIVSLPVDQTLLFFNDTEGQNPPAHDYLGNPIPTTGGALEDKIIMGTLNYEGSAINSGAQNHISNLSNLLPSSTTDGVLETNNGAVPSTDLKTYSYLFPEDYTTASADWAQAFTITNISNDGNGNALIQLDTTGLRPYFPQWDRMQNIVQVTITGTTNYNGTWSIQSLPQPTHDNTTLQQEYWQAVLSAPFVSDGFKM